MNAPAKIVTPAASRLLKARDTALDRLHRMPESWTRDMLVMTADIASRVARYPANSADEHSALAEAQLQAATVCQSLLKAADLCAVLEGVQPE